MCFSCDEIRPWLVLVVFSLTCGINSFMFMDFSVIYTVSEFVFDCGDFKLNWLYSASLIAVLPVAIPVSSLIRTHNYITVGMCVLFNTAGAFLRYLAVVKESWNIALISSILIGFAASVIIVGYTEISAKWFDEKRRTLATTIAVQSNYGGWLLGAVLIPYVINVSDENPSQHQLEAGKDRLQSLMFYQFIVAACSLLIFFLFYRSSPRNEYAQTEIPNATASFMQKREEDTHEGFWASILELGRDFQFVLQMFVFSVMGGISFAVPAVQDVIFENLKTNNATGSGSTLKSSETAWTNFAFILSGIILGLVLGFYVKNPDTFGLVLKLLFVLASISLTAVTIICYMSETFNHDLLWILLCVTMSLSGAPLLGFIGIGLGSAVEQAHPVGHGYSGGAVEWFVQVFGALITQVATDVSSHGMTICMGASWLVTIIFLIGYAPSSKSHRVQSIYDVAG